MVGYSPWGRKELDTTERLHFTSQLSEKKKFNHKGYVPTWENVFDMFSEGRITLNYTPFLYTYMAKPIQYCKVISEVKVKSLNRVRLFATPWTVAYHAPPSVGFSRQEYWSGLPFPSPMLESEK